MTRREMYCTLLAEAIVGETMAIRTYRELMRLAPTHLAKAAHLRMGSEEMIHRKIDQLLCSRYCGFGLSRIRTRKSRR